jgi:hypothetical protein
VAFHVEIAASPLRHARAFNLSGEELSASIVEPWLEDRPIELGDREWTPSECTLRILEGPELAATDLSFGQGWSNAERASEEVTRSVLRSAPAPRFPDAYVLESDDAERLASDLVRENGGRAVGWREATAMIDGRDEEIAAVLVVRRRPAGAEPRRS